MLLDVVLERGLLLLQLLAIHLIVVLLARTLEGLLDVLDLLRHQEGFGLALADLHRVDGVLLVQLDQGLLKLDDVLVRDLDLLLDVLLLEVVDSP